MIHPSTALKYINSVIGYGVVATERIPRGSITWAIDDLDQVLDEDTSTALAPLFERSLDHFTYRDSLGNIILCWDIARYMNHHCNSNCLGTDYGFEVAVRGIAPGEELTVDYASLHLHPHEGFDCACGSPVCRGRISPLDADVLKPAWSKRFRAGLAHVGKVKQPLRPLVSENALTTACAAHGVPVPPVMFEEAPAPALRRTALLNRNRPSRLDVEQARILAD